MTAPKRDLRRMPRLARALRLVEAVDALQFTCPNCKQRVGAPCLAGDPLGCMPRRRLARELRELL